MSKGSASLEDLGGVTAIIEAAPQIVAGPFLDILVAATARASDADRAALAPVLLQGFAACRTPASFRDALGLVLDSKALADLLSRPLVAVLVFRVEDRAAVGQSLLATYAMEALFRIALIEPAARYRLLGIMAELTAEEPGLFAEHAAVLVGAAFHRWREGPLLDTLARLQCVNDAAPGSAFELALARFAEALDAPSLDDALARMAVARELFETVLLADPDRGDAKAYLAIVDTLAGFAIGVAPNKLEGLLAGLERAVNERQGLLAVGPVPSWLQPRCDREVEWLRVVDIAQQVAVNLTRPSWLNAAQLLEQVLVLYEADRTILLGRNLHQLFAPRIEASFVRQAGLIAHLDDLLADKAWHPQLRPAAENLRLAIRARQPENRPRIALEDASYPLLSGVLPDEQAGRDLPADLAQALETALAAHISQRELPASPVVNRIFEEIAFSLAACPDYQGVVRQRFDDLLLQIIAFCSDRQDADKRTAGTRIAYLRSKAASEADLQFDLREWLAGNMSAADVRSEVPGVAAGRTDLYIGFGAFRFIIELKKHSGRVDPSGAMNYRGQAATYQATGVRLGFLGILELADRAGPPPSLEECFWLDVFVPADAELPRYLVTFRVPGMLKPPSSLP